TAHRATPLRARGWLGDRRPPALAAPPVRQARAMTGPRCESSAPRSADREEGLRIRGGRADAHPGGDRAGDRGQGASRRPGLALGDGRHADVASLADRDVERDAAEEVDLVLLAEALAAAAPEDLGELAAVRADECRHVLDQAENRDRQALEHREGLADV